MSRKKISSNFDTVIGKNTTLTGDIKCNGSLRIDGLVTGDINADGNMLIGKDGSVKGNIQATNIHLAGTVEGNIKAFGILRIMSTTKLLGDVQVKSFVADEGAVFQGNCQMIEIEDDRSRRKNRRSKTSNEQQDNTEKN